MPRRNINACRSFLNLHWHMKMNLPLLGYEDWMISIDVIDLPTMMFPSWADTTSTVQWHHFSHSVSPCFVKYNISGNTKWLINDWTSCQLSKENCMKNDHQNDFLFCQGSLYYSCQWVCNYNIRSMNFHLITGTALMYVWYMSITVLRKLFTTWPMTLGNFSSRLEKWFCKPMVLFKISLVEWVILFLLSNYLPLGCNLDMIMKIYGVNIIATASLSRSVLFDYICNPNKRLWVPTNFW